MKLWPGKTEQPKQRLADAIPQDVMKVLGHGEDSVSVGFEEVPASDWAAHQRALLLLRIVPCAGT